MSNNVKVMDKTPETKPFSVNDMELNKIMMISVPQLRGLIDPEAFKKNLRHEAAYAPASMRSLALALNETSGNSDTIEICRVNGEIRVSEGNRRTAVMLTQKFEFSEGKGTDKRDIDISPSSWNVKITFIGDRTEKEYLQLISNQLLQKPIGKGEKFDLIKRYVELSYKEADIKRLTSFTPGVVQPALRTMRIANSLKNAKYAIAEKIKDKDERTKAMSEALNSADAVIEAYKDSTLTVDMINAISPLTTAPVVKGKEEEAATALLAKYTEVFANKADKETVRTWKDIINVILPQVHPRFKAFALAIKTAGEFDVTAYKELK